MKSGLPVFLRKRPLLKWGLLLSGLGVLLLALPFILIFTWLAGAQIYGGLTNPPYAQCYAVPQTKPELQKALEHGFDPNQTCCRDTMIGSCIIVKREDPNNEYVLSFAAREGKIAMVQALLELGARSAGTDALVAGVASPAITALLLRQPYSDAELTKAMIKAAGGNATQSVLLLKQAMTQKNLPLPIDAMRLELLNAVTDAMRMLPPNVMPNPEPEKRIIPIIIQAQNSAVVPLTTRDYAQLICNLVDKFQFDYSANPPRQQSFTTLYNLFTAQGVDANFICSNNRPLWLTMALAGDALYLQMQALLPHADLFLKDKQGRAFYHGEALTDPHGGNYGTPPSYAKTNALLAPIYSQQLIEQTTGKPVDPNLPFYVNGKRIH